MQPVICDPISPCLFSAEGFVGLLFLGVVAISISGAVVATMSKQLIRAIAGLALCFFGVAVIYYFLNGPFISMMQLLIYVGAVSIIIAFGIMLANPDDNAASHLKSSNLLVGLPGIVLGVFIFSALSLMAVRTEWTKFASTGDASIESIGKILLTSHGMVFELISFVLLIAILGAIVLARKGRYAAAESAGTEQEN